MKETAKPFHSIIVLAVLLLVIACSRSGPHIEVSQGDDILQPKKHYVFFGETDRATFTIKNTGTADLTLTGNPPIRKSGTDTYKFAVQQPESPVKPGESVDFSIYRYYKTTEALTIDVIIESNDPDTGQFSFTINAPGIAAEVPDSQYHTKQEGQWVWFIPSKKRETGTEVQENESKAIPKNTSIKKEKVRP